MFNYNSKNLVLENLLNLSREINMYVTMFRNIDDLTYSMKTYEIQSKFNNIVGHKNSNLSYYLATRIMKINLDRTQPNSIKLLDVSNCILDLGRSV